VVVPLRPSANQLQRALLPPRGTKVTIILTFQHAFFFFFIFPLGRWRKFNPVADKFASYAVNKAVCISQMDKNRRGQKKHQYSGVGHIPRKTILVSMKKIFTIEG
jgi:hypothetical protein